MACSNKNSPAIRIISMVLFLFSLGYLITYLYDFSVNSLQVDFSAYYTAGEALLHDYSPYENNIVSNPMVWDGINITQHSRFLYPPIAAVLFQSIAKIPYHYAKMVWSILSLLEVGLALYIVQKPFPLRSPQRILISGACVCLYFPLLAHLERGQIDTLTLFILVLAIYWMKADGKKDFISGILISLAVLFKLHSIYLVPFLLIERRWRVLYGFTAGMLILFGISFLMPNGSLLLGNYLFHEIPRIANYGNPDHGDIPLKMEVIEAVLKDIPDGYTFKEPTMLDFSGNATFVRVLHEAINSPETASHSILSVVTFIALFPGLLFWRFLFINIKTPSDEFIYWLAILDVILLSAPLTHVMNVVWLLPLVLVVFSVATNTLSTHQKYGYILLCIGMLFIGIPEAIFIVKIIPAKILIGECLVLAGCLMYISNKQSASHTPSLISLFFFHRPHRH
jgi:hypothetical protein